MNTHELRGGRTGRCVGVLLRAVAAGGGWKWVAGKKGGLLFQKPLDSPARPHHLLSAQLLCVWVCVPKYTHIHKHLLTGLMELFPTKTAFLATTNINSPVISMRIFKTVTLKSDNGPTVGP